MSCKKSVISTGVVGCKTARACDSCVKKRARWYCAADDAFLCQACDNSVHSANPLARRHTRVRLNTASSSSTRGGKPMPTWHRGFTKKARTPRSNGKSKHVEASRDPMMFPAMVPEICSDETTISHEENDQQLLYRVPILDPLVAELCSAAATTSTSGNSIEDVSKIGNENDRVDDRSKVAMSSENCEADMIIAQAFVPTEMDLADFAADVESLLGRGLENECDFGIEGLGFVDCEEKEFSGAGRVKVEEDDEEEEEVEDKNATSKGFWAESSMEMDMMRPEPFELNFEDDDESPADHNDSQEDRKIEVSLEIQHGASKKRSGEEDAKKSSTKKKKKKILLRLDYEAVITEWASQGSPWTTGGRPDFDPETCWPNCMGSFDTQLHHHHHYIDLGGLVGGNPAVVSDVGREARVSRYREKRRNRLFSKKIRYEVRKLNAEKRPRMKGRFVKRASFPAVK